MNMWRQQARSNRLIEVMSDDGATEAAIESRPAPHKIPATAEINLHHALEMATHRKCGELWRAYGMCKDTTKQGHEKCKGCEIEGPPSLGVGSLGPGRVLTHRGNQAREG